MISLQERGIRILFQSFRTRIQHTEAVLHKSPKHPRVGFEDIVCSSRESVKVVFLLKHVDDFEEFSEHFISAQNKGEEKIFKKKGFSSDQEKELKFHLPG